MQTGARSGTGGARLADGGLTITSAESTIEAECRAEAVRELGTDQIVDRFTGWNVAQLTFHDLIQIWEDGWCFEALNFSLASIDFDDGPGGVMRFKTDTPAMGHVANGHIHNEKGGPFLPDILTPATPGFFRARFKLKTGVDSETLLSFGVRNSDAKVGAGQGNVMHFGVEGSGWGGGNADGSIAFCCDGINGATATKIPLFTADLLWHDYKMKWRGDGQVTVWTDVTPRLVVTPAIPIDTVVIPEVTYSNGNTAANREFVSGYIYQACVPGQGKQFNCL